jgi:hypothetical protein
LSLSGPGSNGCGDLALGRLQHAADHAIGEREQKLRSGLEALKADHAVRAAVDDALRDVDAVSASLQAALLMTNASFESMN